MKFRYGFPLFPENSYSSVESTKKTMKFLYSYGGKIIPRPTDGVLRYLGGYTRVLSVDRSISFAELMAKFEESCGSSMDLKCKLPTEDLDLLVTINSDEDLGNVVEEYEEASPEAKIRAVLFPIKSRKGVSPSPPSSPMSCFDFPSPKKPPRVPVRSPAAVRSPAPSPSPSPPSRYAAQPCAAANHCFPPASVGYPTGKCRCCQGWSPSPSPSPSHMQHAPVPQWSYSRSYYYR